MSNVHSSGNYNFPAQLSGSLLLTDIYIDIVGSMINDTEAGAFCVASGLCTNEFLEEAKQAIAHGQEATSTTSSATVTPALVKHISPDGSLRDQAFSLRVGNDIDVPRGEKGSILTFSVDSSSFPRRHDRSLAKKALLRAAKPWNSMNLGITLRLARVNEPAVFQLVYSPNTTSTHDGVLLAKAFPPDARAEDRRLIVYASHFDSRFVNSMTNTFLHEIGHILGFRHEFVERWPSVLFGEENPRSIMSYAQDPRDLRIQRTDITWMQKFYALTDRYLGGLPIKDVAPQLPTSGLTIGGVRYSARQQVLST
ncbi:hypothetical protein N0V93_009553 [Gnomoniopsis smithogilvyi]|uniref:Peptidase metallopeptidase domain-containing protein n=1 Tax=Gnomoniopsis smithogilvyi TaxID=1191159 RepID=A0A9W8YJU8_9PEZI|nr:hypothetical protein N0V93_009553 [Gnomoniopsis smithogilvyi]